MCAFNVISQFVLMGAPASRGQPARAEQPERTEATQDKPPSGQRAGRWYWCCNDHLANMLRSSQLPQPICCRAHWVATERQWVYCT